jgi:hypothetical protein
MDKFGDQVSHQLSAGLCADPADTGGVDVDDATAPMHGDGVGAVVHQPPVPLLDNICLHLSTIGGWMHNAAFDLAVAEVIVPRPQPDPLPVVVEPHYSKRLDHTGRNNGRK